MKIFLVLFIFLTNVYISSAQLVFNNGAYMVMDGGTVATPVYAVLGGTAIPLTPILVNTNGGIVAENEYHKLRYSLGTNTTNINVPFLRGATLTNKVDVSLAAITAGTGAGSIDFSNKAATITATGWDNTIYLPSMVTHMSQNTAPSTNGSDYAIDRFWIVDPTAYTTKPAGTLTFTYLDDELAANAGNTITEANLQPQRFNNVSNIWGDFISGINYVPNVINVLSNTISVPVTAVNFYAAWTLADRTNPLPITLKSITANCIDNNVKIEWITASETNNNYFTIEKSINAISFEPIATIAGAGNSTLDKSYNYSFSETSNTQIYYRLKQTDYDGKYEYSNLFSTTCGNSIATFSFEKVYATDENNLTLIINSTTTETKNINVTNTLGQVLYNAPHTLNAGYNQFIITTPSLAKAMYFVSLVNGNSLTTKKIIIQ
ncbi:MAG: T9SS type A sorting domain-containing protein [Bacteroidia bacterium]|nr:T9SS type A sorting domain-containing protein [Bacteroidia bacterium]